MEMLKRLFGRGIPAYLWIAVIYIVFVAIVAVPHLWESAFGEMEGTASQSTVETVERLMNDPIVTITLLSGNNFPITLTTIFIILGFISAWIEVLRATNARASGNDLMSLIVTIVALVLFVGVPWFGTTAFMIVPLVGFGDLLLDRYVGQAVARRDFGPVYPPHGG